jgi:hypothetical protein
MKCYLVYLFPRFCTQVSRSVGRSRRVHRRSGEMQLVLVISLPLVALVIIVAIVLCIICR